MLADVSAPAQIHRTATAIGYKIMVEVKDVPAIVPLFAIINQ